MLSSESEDLLALLRQRKKNWSLAHQNAAGSVSAVARYLGAISTATHRNSMPYRHLGLVRGNGVTNGRDHGAARTPAGDAFVGASTEVEQQAIFDEQAAKVRLDSQSGGGVAVWPLRVIIRLLLAVDHISPIEYDVVVGWVDESDDLEGIGTLILELRSEPAEVMKLHLQAAASAVGRTAASLEDSLKRWRQIFGAVSAIETGQHGELRLAVSGESARAFLTSIDDLIATGTAGQDWRETFNGGYFAGNPAPAHRGFARPAADATTGQETSTHFPLLTDVQLSTELTVEFTPSRFNDEVKRKADFELLQGSKSKGGLRAEQLVLEHERRRLRHEGRRDLAAAVSQVSLTSDLAGFDVSSFNADGSKRLIEVKGVKPLTLRPRIFVSRREIERSRLDDSWVIVVVIGYGSDAPAVLESVELTSFVRALEVGTTSSGVITGRPQGHEVQLVLGELRT
jgi:hypothetical protein